MIVYRMACGLGHEFEGWFKNSAAYDAQEEQGALACPLCGDVSIRKAPMAPAVTKANSAKELPTAPALSDDAKRTRQFMTGIRKFVEENAEYVGARFPEEARRIHLRETEDRHIYGEATLKEARNLVEEGISIAPLPPDPDKLN
ncbi:MAG: DUF1178 family protein [Alphaproteobacteria bacterium]